MSAGSGRWYAAVAVALAVLVAGCSVSQPDPSGWDQKAHLAVTDASSEVATAQLTLRSLSHDRLWSSYAVVALASAEEAVSKAEDSVAPLQPPPARKDDAKDLLDVLSRAEDAVRAAREAVVAGHPDDQGVRHDLSGAAKALERAGRRWKE